jgi:Fe-S cluster biogenesis protein NfuA
MDTIQHPPTSQPHVIDRVSAIIERVRPYLQSHGGDVEVVGIHEDVLTLKVIGSCAQCALVNLTYNKIVKTLLAEEVPEIQRVVLT